MKGRFIFACDRKQDEQDHEACWWCRSLAGVLHKMHANMKYLLYFIFIWVNLLSMPGFANCKILKTIICFIDNIFLFLPDNVRFLNALMFFFSFEKSCWKIYFGASLTTLTEKIKFGFVLWNVETWWFVKCYPLRPVSYAFVSVILTFLDTPTPRILQSLLFFPHFLFHNVKRNVEFLAL